MSLWQKISQSVFNALTPRSAGFVSVNPASFLPATLLIVVIQMWIGGASQSMAGGIKVNTLAVVVLNLRSVARGHAGVTAWHRSIAMPSVRRANAVLALSVFAYFVFAFVLLQMEPELSVRAALFEVVSALFTVGSSLGITENLCDNSKILLCAAMFLGLVGVL